METVAQDSQPSRCHWRTSIEGHDSHGVRPPRVGCGYLFLCARHRPLGAAGNIQLMRLAPVRGGEVRRRRRTSMCRAYVLMRRAAVDPKAAVRRSVPKALSILASTDIAAVWVQAIERRARNEVADVLDKPVAPARRWYHAISHAPGPRTQWRIRPHRPDQSLIGDSYS